MFYLSNLKRSIMDIMKMKKTSTENSKNYAIEMLEIGYNNSLQGVFKHDVIDQVRNIYLSNDEDVMTITTEKFNKKTGEMEEFDIPIQDYYGVLESTFNELFQVVYIDEEEGRPQLNLYILKPEYTAHYLSYKQLQDSKKQSSKAIKIAVASIVIASFTSFISIIFNYKQLINSEKPIFIKTEVETSINNTSQKIDIILDTLKNINSKLK